RAVLRVQGRGPGAHARDGRRPRARGDPRELREPRHRRHPVGRPPARRRGRPRRRARRAGGTPAHGTAREPRGRRARRVLPREPARGGDHGRGARSRRRHAHAPGPPAGGVVTRGTADAPALPRREVRGTGVRLTSLGFGAAQAGNLFRATTDEETAAAVEAAWDLGVRYFDTAPHYGLGLSERRLGAALRGRPRDEHVVSSKVGRLLVPSPGTAHERDPDLFDVPADHRRVWDFSRDGVLRSIDATLARTGLDRVDVVYLHDPDDHEDAAVHEALPALVDLRDQGVVGAIGAGMNQSAMLARFVRTGDVDVVMCAG